MKKLLCKLCLLAVLAVTIVSGCTKEGTSSTVPEQKEVKPTTSEFANGESSPNVLEDAEVKPTTSNCIKEDSLDVLKQVEVKGGLKLTAGPEKVKPTDKEIKQSKVLLSKRLDLMGIENYDIKFDESGNVIIYFASYKNLSTEDIYATMDSIIRRGEFSVQELEESENLSINPSGKIIFDGKDILDVKVYKQSEKVSLMIKLNKTSSEDFEKASKRLIGKRIAVLSDSMIVSAPTINAEITDGKLVLEGLTEKEAIELRNMIKVGVLPYELTIKGLDVIKPKK